MTDTRSSSGTVEAFAALLMRCRTVLGNMAAENEGAMFKRWPINHEPLRADAKNLVSLIDQALAAHHETIMASYRGAAQAVPATNAPPKIEYFGDAETASE